MSNLLRANENSVTAFAAHAGGLGFVARTICGGGVVVVGVCVCVCVCFVCIP